MLNPNSPVPLYHQLAEIILGRIRSGEYPSGSRIPSEYSFAGEYGIGRPTVRQATDLLVRKRMVVRKRGSGTFVLEKQDEIDLFSLGGTISAFKKKGIPVTSRIIEKTSLQFVEGDDENPFSGRKSYFLSRLTLAEGQPVLIEDIYLQHELFSGIDRIDLSDRSLSRVVYENYYMRPIGGKQTFKTGNLSGKRVADLNVPAHMPILMVRRFLDFQGAENAIYSEIFCRTDRFVFSQELKGIEDG